MSVALEQDGQRYVIQPGRGEGPWTFSFGKHLAASQPFDVVARRAVGWGTALALDAALGGAGGAGRGRLAMAAAAARGARAREELLRLGQVARLNTLGELAAGMAHELNQPLSACWQHAGRAAAAGRRAAGPGHRARRHAQAEQQARRAADVVARLRRGVERPAASASLQPVVLQDAVRNAFYLLEPEFAKRQVAPKLEAQGGALAVQAEPVALEQIIHNLLTNALQALDQVPPEERKLSVRLEEDQGQGALTVGDTGPASRPRCCPASSNPSSPRASTASAWA